MPKHKKKRFYKRKKLKYTYIYEIQADKYFYIGKSNHPWRRFEVHKRRAIENKGRNPRKNLIFKKNLRKLRLRIIEKVKMNKWREKEIHYIASYRRRYGRERVLNISDGGDGEDGGYHKKKESPLNALISPFVILFFILLICAVLKVS